MVDLSWQFRKRCEGLSTELRTELALKAYDPLPARLLAKKLDAKLRTPLQMIQASDEASEYLSQIDETIWSGVILRFKPLIILYNPNLSSVRFESTIMHELGHFILKHPPGKLYLAPTGELERDFDSLIEAEASYLGSCLQIPRRGIHWALQRKMKEQSIAKHFGASMEMVRWRLNATQF